MTLLATRKALAGSVPSRVARRLELADAHGLPADSLRTRDDTDRLALIGGRGTARFSDLTSDATSPMYRHLAATLAAGRGNPR
jgi:hypothetical protein